MENSAPFLAILFWNQLKGMDLKVWEGGGGGVRKGLEGGQVQLLPGGFLQ